MNIESKEIKHYEQIKQSWKTNLSGEVSIVEAACIQPIYIHICRCFSIDSCIQILSVHFFIYVENLELNKETITSVTLGQLIVFRFHHGITSTATLLSFLPLFNDKIQGCIYIIL